MPGQPVTPPTVPEVDGTLLKLKHHKPRLTSAWTRRYFRMVADEEGLGVLEYRSSKSETLAKKCIHLTDVSSIVEFDQLSFQINCREKSFLLRAASPAEVACWVPALQLYLRELNTYKIATSSSRNMA